MSTGQHPNLPHPRRGPRIDERRRGEDDPVVLHGIFAVGYVIGVVLLVAFAFGVIG